MKINTQILKINSYSESKRIQKPIVLKEKQDLDCLTLPNQCVAYVHPSFGRKNSTTALKRAIKLKNLYAKEGISYFLPNQVWSDKKIINAIECFDKLFSKLSESNKKTFQKALNTFLPEHAKDKIIIKDFNDLKKYLSNAGNPDNAIDNYLKSVQAVSANEKDSSTIYLKFDTKVSSPTIKNQFKHELKHAFTNTLQNCYKSIRYNDSDKFDFFHHMFFTIEKFYVKPFDIKNNVSLTKENMLKSYGFKSLEDLHQDFNLKIANIAQDDFFATEFNSYSHKDFKHMFGYLRLAAKDEKEAYFFDKEYRILNENSNLPTELELRSLFYAEMERFFAKNENIYKKLLPKNQRISAA